MDVDVIAKLVEGAPKEIQKMAKDFLKTCESYEQNKNSLRKIKEEYSFQKAQFIKAIQDFQKGDK